MTDLLERLHPERVMVFTGGNSYRASGASATVDPLLAGTSVARVDNIQPNPTLESVTEAITRHRAFEPDLIVAIGGGSVLDLAKSVRVLAPQNATPRSIITGNGAITRNGAPLIAVPTTAGTGSETTHFSVVYVDGIKHSLAHNAIRPDFALLDPELTYSAPPSVTAATGLDALSQAMESLWSVRSTADSRRFASTALRLAIDWLPTAVHEPDPVSRTHMCEASHQAGRAIDVTTTTAPHALSYALTSGYGLPHGHAVALTLGAVLEYNGQVTAADCADPRGVAHVQETIGDIVSMLGVSTASEAREAITDLVGSLGLEPTLAGVGAASPDARHRLAAAVNIERLAGNPRVFTPRSLLDLVLTIP